METLPPSPGVLGQQGTQNPYGDALRDVGVEEFLDMMIAELQNQDPLNPMDNQQIVEQIGQIREILSNDRLTETLDSVFLGQNLATAGGMIGDWIVHLADDDTVRVAGQVDRVAIEEGIPKIYVGDEAVQLKNISLIQSETEGQQLAVVMGLIGMKIRGMTDGSLQELSREVTGWVDRVSMHGNQVKLHIGEDTIDPDNVLEIITAPSGT
jgi:flagellar basal-body rod modification protein FlgD